MTIVDTPEGIAFAHMLAVRGACRLHLKGLRHSSGRSPIALAKRLYGIKGTGPQVVAQLDAMIEATLNERRGA